MVTADLRAILPATRLSWAGENCVIQRQAVCAVGFVPKGALVSNPASDKELRHVLATAFRIDRFVSVQPSPLMEEEKDDDVVALSSLTYVASPLFSSIHPQGMPYLLRPRIALMHPDRHRVYRSSDGSNLRTYYHWWIPLRIGRINGEEFSDCRLHPALGAGPLRRAHECEPTNIGVHILSETDSEAVEWHREALGV
jgi:hypothetical protein